MKQLAPGYDLLAQSTFTRKIELKEKNCLLQLKKLFANNYVGLTADWSEMNFRSFTTVTAHCIPSTADSTAMMNYVLATKHVFEGHTGSNIADWIRSILQEVCIDPNKVAALVNDNGANMVLAAELLNFEHGWEHIRCAAHTLQLCIKDVLHSCNAIKSATVAARHPVTFSSNQQKLKLH